MTYILLGKPIPLCRARHGKGRTYDTQKVEKMWTKNALFAQSPSLNLLSCPLQLKVTFYMPMPPSWPERKKKEHVGRPHTSKPDTDNLIKYIADCGTGILYTDDSLISSIICKKIWDWTGKTEFSLIEIL